MTPLAVLDIVPSWAWAGLLSAALLHGCYVGHQRDQAQVQKATLQSSIDHDRAERQAVALNAATNFRNQERRAGQAAMEIEDAHQKTERADQVALDRAHRAHDGLLRDIAAINQAARSRDVPSAAACPSELESSRRAAEAARNTLGACSERYRTVASDLDANERDLDAALRYVDLVQTSAPASKGKGATPTP